MTSVALVFEPLSTSAVSSLLALLVVTSLTTISPFTYEISRRTDGRTHSYTHARTDGQTGNIMPPSPVTKGGIKELIGLHVTPIRLYNQ